MCNPSRQLLAAPGVTQQTYTWSLNSSLSLTVGCLHQADNRNTADWFRHGEIDLVGCDGRRVILQRRNHVIHSISPDFSPLEAKVINDTHEMCFLFTSDRTVRVRAVQTFLSEVHVGAQLCFNDVV